MLFKSSRDCQLFCNKIGVHKYECVVQKVADVFVKITIFILKQ